MTAIANAPTGPKITEYRLHNRSHKDSRTDNYKHCVFVFHLDPNQPSKVYVRAIFPSVDIEYEDHEHLRFYYFMEHLMTLFGPMDWRYSTTEAENGACKTHWYYLKYDPAHFCFFIPEEEVPGGSIAPEDRIEKGDFLRSKGHQLSIAGARNLWKVLIRQGWELFTP